MHFDSFRLHKWRLRQHKPHGEYHSPLFSLLIDKPWIAVDGNNRGWPLESAAKHRNRRGHSLVGFLPVGPARTSSAVVSLDYEGVFLLALAVDRAAGSQDALSRCAIQHHRFKRGVLAVDLKSTDLPWRKQEENNESMHENCCEAPKLWPSGASSFCRNGKFAMPTKKKERNLHQGETDACVRC